jgi:hypothetical protein
MKLKMKPIRLSLIDFRHLVTLLNQANERETRAGRGKKAGKNMTKLLFMSCILNLAKSWFGRQDKRKNHSCCAAADQTILISAGMGGLMVGGGGLLGENLACKLDAGLSHAGNCLGDDNDNKVSQKAELFASFPRLTMTSAFSQLR